MTFLKLPNEEYILKDMESKDSQPFYKVVANLETMDNLVKLGILVDFLKRKNPLCKIFLTVSYLAYAQSDRQTDGSLGLGLKVISKFIKTMPIDSFVFIDPHPDGIENIFDNCTIYRINSDAFSYLNDVVDAIVAPDAGAFKRICAQKDLNYKVIPCIKTRYKDGLLKTQVVADEKDINGQNLLIVDDICIGGGTFIKLAQEIRDKGFTPKSISLFITHPVFAFNTEILSETFSKVYYGNTRTPLAKHTLPSNFIKIEIIDYSKFDYWIL